ncbi:MAG: phosphoenolpyruvate--protein phosphotransferase [Ruminococcus sp.]|nr:phosphoenolpyruvate--protein phosphotransferase [Ruminococcus sp.]
MNKFSGIGASGGIAIGNAAIVKEAVVSYEKKVIDNPEQEIKRLEAAFERFKEKTEKMALSIEEKVGEKEAEILRGHIAIAFDPALSDEINKLIKSGKCAEEAVDSVCEQFIAMFASIPDEMMRQRATDISDVKTRLLQILTDNEPTDISGLAPDTILVADDLTPSMTAGIDKENVLGILTKTGGKTSHSAILARALEIPAVLSAPDAVDALTDGVVVIVDGEKGEVIIDPDEQTVEKYKKLREEYIQAKKELSKFIGRKTQTADGESVMLFGNIGNPEEAKTVKSFDGEGVGLFRTEFLFMENSSAPTEEEQFEAYKAAVEALDGGSVIIRTLDVGGDKEIPYLGLEKEENPFLGYRAVRFCLNRDDIYNTQLRALLRASAYGDIKIMIPLVTCVDELLAVKEKLFTLKSELDSEGIPYNKDIEVGVMIETPAACVSADILAKEADFFSIGTNDLTQYTMAVDRGNAKVAYLYSEYNIAVLRSIKRIIECAKKEGIVCGMCGEAAADPNLIPLLISFGLDEFSVSATSILKTRKIISLWSKDDADELANKALSLTRESEISALLKANARK